MTCFRGRNGHGKSTILDALCFVQFGKPFRKINKPKLVNSINNKDCLIELTFLENGKEYLLRRGIKPDIFEVYQDGNLVPQLSGISAYQDWLENNVLRMNLKSFTQIVILGAATFVPFMQLEAKDRRMIIEDILDIQIFSSMNEILKQKVKNTKEALEANKNEQKVIKANIISTEKLILTLKNNLSERLEENAGEIRTHKIFIEGYDKEITILQGKINELGEVEDAKIQEEINKIISLEAKLEDKNKSLQKEIKFYSENDLCPICKQDIENDFKEKTVRGKQKKKEEIISALEEIEANLQEKNNRLKEIKKLQKQIVEYRTKIREYETLKMTANGRILWCQKQIKLHEDDTGNLEGEEKNLDDLRKEEKKLEDQYQNLLIDKNYLDVSTVLLKDTGIKSRIIKQYIPILNKTINKYLSEMEFFVNFFLDENFEEVIKSRHRDVFQYENFSEGEKLRINLAIMFALREVARLKNSINCNLLIMDEILDSSLDQKGTETLMEIFKKFDKTNLLIVSHKDHIMDEYFDRTISFKKRNNFTEISYV